MTEKRFTKCDTKIRDYGEEMTQAEVRDMLNTLHEENEILKKTYDVTENVNIALSEENEELHLLHGELIDKNNSLHKDVSSLVDEIVNLNSKIEHLEMENLQFKKVFNEIIKQVNVELDPHYSRYAAIIVFSVQEFEFIRKMMKEELK